VGGLDFGVHFWGTPFISETIGESGLLEDQDHFLVAHFYEDPVEGERVELWVNPTRLRPTLTGDPPLPPTSRMGRAATSSSAGRLDRLRDDVADLLRERHRAGR
jgi:hypothetical protein